ncbi:hypothetical protein D3C78_1496720 [compost metagenome]
MISRLSVAHWIHLIANSLTTLEIIELSVSFQRHYKCAIVGDYRHLKMRDITMKKPGRIDADRALKVHLICRT